jgi:hypothetical protein
LDYIRAKEKRIHLDGTLEIFEEGKDDREIRAQEYRTRLWEAERMIGKYDQ